MPDLSILIRNKGSGTEKEEENKTLLNNQNEIEIEGSLPLHSTLASTPFPSFRQIIYFKVFIFLSYRIYVSSLRSR